MEEQKEESRQELRSGFLLHWAKGLWKTMGTLIMTEARAALHENDQEKVNPKLPN